MISLYQRLKELDPDTFQRFCAQLLKERHPGVEIRHVEGASGDKGLDVFSGTLANVTVIWQCKAFPNGVGKSQKEQIRESLRAALKHFKPGEWILCLSVDLDAKAHRWFQKLAKSHQARTKIGLLSATDIVHELIHRRSLREHFFPGAAIDVVELKRLITRTGELTAEELEKLNETNLEDYITRLQERDARFNYEVVVRTEGGPQSTPPRPGLVLSIARGSQTVNVFARDVQALRANPPKLSFTIQGDGLAKYQSLVRTGIPQQFTSSELVNLNSDWAVIAPMIDIPGYQVIVGPSASLTSKRIKAQVTFLSSSASIVYPLLEFAPTRAGVDEAEIQTISRVPFRLKFVLPLNSQMQGSMSFETDFIGHDVHAVNKFLSALEILRDGGEIKFVDLEHDRELFRGTPSLKAAKDQEIRAQQLIRDLVKISEIFSVELRLPRVISKEDEDSILSLKKCIEGAVEEATELTMTLVKSKENEGSLAEVFSGPIVLRIDLPSYDPRPKLFGKEIDTGPCAFVFDDVVLKDRQGTLNRFNAAAIGDAVLVTCLTKSVRHQLLR